MIVLHIFVLIVSIVFLILSSEWLVKSLTKIAQIFHWREFVFAFFMMAFVGNLPNLFVGISSVLQGVPHLSLGEILGGNIIDLTVVAALAALVSRNGLTVKSRTVQGTAIFALIIALLPLLLVYDRVLSRIDGIILIFAFIVYFFWLFSKEERFTRVFDGDKKKIKTEDFLKSFFTLIGAFILLLLAAEGVVRSSVFFAEISNLPLVLIGILVVGAGNALPELFFGIQAAKKGSDWMVIGGLMGAVISAAGLILGIVSLLSPIKIDELDFSLLAITRFFLIIAAVFFLLFIRSGHKITQKEGIVLLVIYLLFVVAQLLTI